MDEACCSRLSAGSDACELPSPKVERPQRLVTACPVCNEKGKPVESKTVKALLSVTLREAQNNAEYLFCRTQNCPTVYYSSDGKQTFTIEQIRERVYQKEPDGEDVFVCYCFRHTVGEFRAASRELRTAMVDDINAGIQADQCACDLRNPQGSCCLGNARGLIKQLEQLTIG